MRTARMKSARRQHHLTLSPPLVRKTDNRWRQREQAGLPKSTGAIDAGHQHVRVGCCRARVDQSTPQGASSGPELIAKRAQADGLLAAGDHQRIVHVDVESEPQRVRVPDRCERLR